MGLRERIIERRKAKGLSKADIARHFKISRSAVAQWERRVEPTTPDPDKMAELATLLDADLLWLMTGTSGPAALSAAQASAAAIAGQLTEADLTQWLRWGEAMVNSYKLAKDEPPGPQHRLPFSNAS